MDNALLESAGTTLQHIGHDLLQSTIALCVESAIWAVYLVLVMISSVILVRKRRSRMSWFLLAVVLAMFALDTAMYIIDIRNAVQEISYTLTSHSTLSLPDRYALTAYFPWPVQSALYGFLSNLGDVIIIWRVYAFYSIGRDRLVVLIPLALLLASFASSGVISFCAAHHFLTNRTIVAGNFMDPPLCKNVQFTSYCLALVTTGVATLLIGFKTWQYRRTISSLLWRAKTRKSQIEKVMTLLVESGILYFLFFLSAVVADTPRVAKLEESSSALSLASRVWTYLTSHIIVRPLVPSPPDCLFTPLCSAFTPWSSSSSCSRSAHTSTLRRLARLPCSSPTP
ncbi:hypothetical protein PHLGIDRAFT_314410 [Phlebiopsis gigantea 11061_1 CR5-6]|uniref:G-protein coupled receptors family 1 profile domain-containing protein n=1 Tax=Phlebiopsis gigantea (strain 11061_1 CR5-6) TaxID=745531 RepID=A0A0C3NBZ4_PHLG1|nr:hypothetical protein PHLGIDRAFT_314410 [Phlebiopsis gigantea 11061_1 CR5-6]